MATVIDDYDVNFGWFGSSWTTNHTGDPLTDTYFNGTFHASTVNGDYCLVAWYGSDIIIYGARRENHGIYGISVDYGDTQYYSGYSGTSSLEQVLFATSGLSEGDHTLKVSNENARNTDQYPQYIWLDIDYVAVTGSLSNAASGGFDSSSSTVSSTSVASPSPQTSPSQSTSDFTLTSSSEVSTLSSSSETSSATPASALSLSGQYTVTASAVEILPTADAAATATATKAGSLLATGPPSTGVTDTTVETASGESATDSSASGNHKTTTIAVSVTVIVMAFVVIVTVSGLWFWRRRKRRQEEQEEHDYLNPAWH